MIKYSEAYLAIGAINLTEVVDFYGQLLGKEPLTYFPGVYAEFQLQGLRLVIFQPKKDNYSEFANSVGSGMSICLEVEDLEKAIAHFEQIACPPPSEIIIASHGKEVYLYDPAGNRLILHQQALKN